MREKSPNQVTNFFFHIPPKWFLINHATLIWGQGQDVAYRLKYYATDRKVAGSRLDGGEWILFKLSDTRTFDSTRPWGSLSLKQKWMLEAEKSKLRPVGRADNLASSMSRFCRQCGILNISQPYRLPRPATGMALFLLPGVMTASIINYESIIKQGLICLLTKAMYY
jgi:hypothetical protein